MEKCLVVFIVARLIGAVPVHNNSVTYDQRQNGRVNVHLSIKDVAIILQGGGAGDDNINYGDYDYDYDHLTVKPVGIWAAEGGLLVPPPSPPASSSSIGEVNSTASSNSTNESITTSLPPKTVTEVAVEVTAAPMSEKTTANLDKTTFKYAWNGDLEEIPVEVIIEPVLKNKQRKNVTNPEYRRNIRRRPLLKKATNLNQRNQEEQRDKRQNIFGVKQLIKLLSLGKAESNEDSENYNYN